MNRKNETLHEKFRKTAALLRRSRVRKFGNYPDTQNRILSLLAIHDGMNQRQLSYLLGIRPQSAGELLMKLENSGLIRRESDEQDGRINRIFLSEAGRQKAETLERERESEDVFDCLNEQEKQQLEELLGKIIELHPTEEEQFKEDIWHIMQEDRPDRHGRRLDPWQFHGENGPDIRNMPFHHRRRCHGQDRPEELPDDEEIKEI